MRYIITDRQYNLLFENVIDEDKIAEYNFNYKSEWPKDNPYRYYFNGLKEINGINHNTEIIKLKDYLNGEVYDFNVDDVKFKDNTTAFIDKKVFDRKYKKPTENIPTKNKPEVSFSLINDEFKYVVFDSLRAIYQNTPNWDSKTHRGPSGRGGVIGIYPVGEFAKEIGVEESEGGDWSIMNYFDTNPKVREKIIKKYLSDNKILKITDIDDFTSWIFDNKKTLFTDGNFLTDIVQINKRSYLTGLKNELKAFNYVKSRIPKNSDYTISSLNLPGSPKDRSGIDFSVFNKGIEYKTYQAKPLDRMEILTRNGEKIYRVYSYNIGNMVNINVSYFIFASDGGKGVVVFENKKGEFNIPTSEKTGKKEDYIDFYYRYKSYDPNF
jgi:hypothetical protein